MLGLLILLTLPPGHGQADFAETVLKLVVFGCQAGTPPAAPELDREVAARLRTVEAPCREFESRTAPPRAASLDGMVAKARWSYEQRLYADARRSPDPLIRFAAEMLQERGACF